MLAKRDFLAGAAASAALAALAPSVRAERQLSVQEVLFDPDIPALGNPDGAITIAEYLTISVRSANVAIRICLM